LESIGAKLRVIRRQRKLSLRAVQQRSLRFAQERHNHSYQVSASWLDRLEREKHDLTISKLIVLANIYEVSPEQFLQPILREAANTPPFKQISVPNATMLPGDGPLGALAKYLLPDEPLLDHFPDETTLLMTQDARPLSPYRRGILGKRGTPNTRWSLVAQSYISIRRGAIFLLKRT
jgi:transcriptional regulator with XRE-family HTH domain